MDQREERQPDAGTGAPAHPRGFLLLLWVFIWSVLRILRTDIYAPTGQLMANRGLNLRSIRPAKTNRRQMQYLLVTEGALAGTRITLGTQPILIGRADDSTLVLTDDYSSTRHARLSPRGRIGTSRI